MKRIKKKSAKGDQDSLCTEDLLLSSSKNPLLVHDKHQQIVHGACRVFFRKGYDQTSIREIAEACDMSMGQLYHYIKGKGDVLYLVYKYMNKTWQEYLRTAKISDTDDAIQKFVSILRHSLLFLIENKNLTQFIFTESKHLDKEHLKGILALDYNYLVRFWTDLLEDVNKQKPLKGDINILGSLLPYIQMFMPLRGWTLKDEPNEKVVDTMITFIMNGLMGKLKP